MKARIEKKLEIEENDYISILFWLKEQNAKLLFPCRYINSIYYDNYNLQMFYETLEGFVPRKKIRIRTYNSKDFFNSKGPYNLEVKLTTFDKRYKSIKNNINFKKIEESGIFDIKYGYCQPKVEISYIREYFLIKGFRVTIDKSIKYKSLIDEKIYLDKSIVLEIKTDINTKDSELIKEIPFPQNRFSKYERAINYLLN